MTPVGIVADRRFLDHNRGAGHIEGPERLEAVYAMIGAGLPFDWLRIEPRAAAREELETIHAPEYIRRLSLTAGRPYVRLDADTSATALSYESARLAVGAVIAAAEAVLDGAVSSAFALVRPPGHHAERDRAMGFCLFNNVALAAEHLVRRRGLGRILIADWDLHHGNGTQRAFYTRSDVLYFSTHAYPYYPGTGFWNEAGEGSGTGFTVNIPLSPGKGDREYRWVFRNILRPVAAAFRPEFILVSAGFDISAGDPLGTMRVTPPGFAALAAELSAMAFETACGRILYVLEGGYDPGRLAEGVRQVLLQAAGIAPVSTVGVEVGPDFLEEIKPVYAVHRSFWPI